MRKLAILVGAIVLLVSLMPVAGRKSSVALISDGKTLAIAQRSSALAWNNGESRVCVDRTNAFSVWEDFFDFPLFIYPFADGERFLCIYDYDTAVLVFVIDFAPSAASTARLPEWPSDAYVRGVLMAGATNVVMKTKGLVRLPGRPELEEVSSTLTSLSVRQLRARSFPALDLGVYRGYWPKEALLAALHTNRQSCWP
jgi:hypothetical protein